MFPNFTASNKNSLFVLDKSNNKAFEKCISEICEQKYYYSFKEKNNNGYNFIVEDYLSKKEFEFSIVFEKIIDSIEGYYYKNMCNICKLNHKEKRILLEYIYFQLLRVPKYIDTLFKNGTEFLTQLNKKYKVIQNNNEIINDLKSILFPRLFEGIGKFVSIVHKRNWAFFVIDKNIHEYFISSDNPILITNHTKEVSKAGIIDPMTEISVPISNKIILTIQETYILNKVEYILINSIDIINKLNLLIKNDALRFVYSNDVSKLDKKYTQDTIFSPPSPIH